MLAGENDIVYCTDCTQIALFGCTEAVTTLVDTLNSDLHISSGWRESRMLELTHEARALPGVSRILQEASGL